MGGTDPRVLVAGKVFKTAFRHMQLEFTRRSRSTPFPMIDISEHHPIRSLHPASNFAMSEHVFETCRLTASLGQGFTLRSRRACDQVHAHSFSCYAGSYYVENGTLDRLYSDK